MKRRITFVLMILFTGFVSHAQIFSSGFESWTAGKPDNWVGAKTNIGPTDFAEYTTNVHEGLKALQLINTTTSHKRFTTDSISVTVLTEYTISFWARGTGDVRTGLFDGRPTGDGYVYNPYIIVNSTNWSQHTQSIVAATDTSIAEFIFSFRNTTAGNDHLQIDDVVISAGAATIDTLTIYDIQFTTAASGDSPYKEKTVYTSGIVTGYSSAGYFIQDGEGAWNGIYIYDNVNSVNAGDSVSLVGSVKEHFGFTQLINITSFNKHSVGHALPEPVFVSVNEVNSEAYESVLVIVGDVKCINTNAGYGMWVVTDGFDTCKVDDFLYKFTPTLSTSYDITAIVNFAYSEFRLSPRRVADVKLASGVETLQNALDINVYPNPAEDVIYISANQSISEVSILCSNGRLISATQAHQKQVGVDISHLSSGTYFVRIKLGDVFVTEKIIVK